MVNNAEQAYSACYNKLNQYLNEYNHSMTGQDYERFPVEDHPSLVRQCVLLPAYRRITAIIKRLGLDMKEFRDFIAEKEAEEYINLITA